MLLSLLYIISFIELYLGILIFPKNNKRCGLSVWLVVTLITVYAIHSVEAIVIYNILKIKIGLLSMSIANVIVAAIIWAVIIFGYKRKQDYYADKTGLYILAGLLVSVYVFGMIRFGWTLGNFRYATSDSAVHLFRVLDIIDTGRLNQSRFYLYLVDALFIETLSPIFGISNYYRLFIICDLFMLFLSGAMFLAIIRRYMADTKLIVLGCVFVLLYVFAYPLNNLIYGFNYLGAAVTLIGYAIFATRSFRDGMMYKWYAILCIVLGIIGVTLCYTQFLPIVFGGSLLYVCTDIVISHKISKKTLISIGIAAVVAGLVGCFGVYYVVIRSYGSIDVLFSNLEGEGPIYRDLWSNIFFLLIFIVFYFKHCIKYKKLHEGCFFVGVLVLYAGYFFIRVCQGKTAAYYFYKFHYAGWFIIMYIAFVGIFWTLKKYYNVYVVYGAICATLFVIMLSGAEKKLNEANVWWVPETKADAYFDIYNWNKEAVVNRLSDVTDDMQAVYYAAGKLIEKEDVMIPYIGSWQNYWVKYYYNLTCQSKYYEYFVDRIVEYEERQEDMVRMLDEMFYSQFDNIKYIMVEKDSVAYWYGIGYFSALPVVYENSYGIIYSVN